MAASNVRGPAVGKVAEWRLRHRLRLAARLSERGTLAPHEYEAIAIGAVCALQQRQRRGARFEIMVFGLEALEALRLPPLRTVTEDSTTDFGPLFGVPADLGEMFPGTRGGGDEYNARSMTLTWGDGCEAILRRALMRLRPWNRWMLAVDDWRGRQRDTFPNLHADLWRLLGMLVAYGLGLVTGVRCFGS